MSAFAHLYLPSCLLSFGMDPAELVALARRAQGERDASRPSKLICKLARKNRGKKSSSREDEALEAQIRIANMTRAVTEDDAMTIPGQTRSDENSIGQGRWRMWNPRSCLQVGFQSGDVASTALAKSMDPPRSRGHVVEVQNCIANICQKKAKSAMAELTCERVTADRLKWFVMDFGMDSTELDVHMKGEHVLAAHGHATWSDSGGARHETPLVYQPLALTENTASCTWRALHHKSVPLEPLPRTKFAKYSGTVVAMDQHVVNYCIIHKLNKEAPTCHLVATDACCQHRTANCLAPMTKHLGIASPVFCLSHVLRYGSTHCDVIKDVEGRLSLPSNLNLVGDEYVADPMDREYAEALLEATYYYEPASDLERSDAERARARAERRRNGEALMHILPGNWRQGLSF